MKRIVLISDTHHYLDESAYKYFEQCDEIWHAGDFGAIEVANKLASFQLLRGVYGNIDGRDIRIIYPEKLRFKCEEVEVLMTHIGGYPGRYNAKIKPELISNPPQLFISGHSHILKVMQDKSNGILHFNPGAAGKQGWHKLRTMLKFCISEKKIHNLEVIELGPR